MSKAKEGAEDLGTFLNPRSERARFERGLRDIARKGGKTVAVEEHTPTETRRTEARPAFGPPKIYRSKRKRS